MVELVFDDEQLIAQIAVAHAGDPNVSNEGQGRFIITFIDDPMGFSSSLSYSFEVSAVDDSFDEGTHVGEVVASVDVLTFDPMFPMNPPEIVTYTEKYGVEIIDNDSPYEVWAAAQGLTTGVNADLTDDPNSDGKTNLEHFALGSNALGFNDLSLIQKLSIETISNTQYLTLTLPVRSGATFTGSGDITATVDGIVYTVRGNSDLSNTGSLTISEVTPALSTGLNILTSDYEYKTFAVPASAQQAFLWVNMEAE